MFSCLLSIDTYVWKFFKMLCFMILLFFMFFFFLIVIVLPLFLTQTTKCSRIPTLKAREFFGNHYVLVFFVCLFLFFFNVTRVQGSFLDLSALKIKTDDQCNIGLSKERACNQNLPVHLQCGKNFGCTHSPSQILSIA